MKRMSGARLVRALVLDGTADEPPVEIPCDGRKH
ncbi:hypothetical protein BH11GEM2_BH11GEM2_36030 [soil metagenome]